MKNGQRQDFRNRQPTENSSFLKKMGQSSSQTSPTENVQSESDKEHPDNKKLEGGDWEDIRQKRRSCTDCLCLV